MEKTVLGTIIAVAIILGIFAIVMIARYDEPPRGNGDGNWQIINLTSENLPSYLSQFSAIHDLPKEGTIKLTLGTNTYTIEQGSVRMGAPREPDASITLPERYLEVFGQRGWCAGLREARDTGELGIEMHSPQLELAWKYRALRKYLSCLG